MSKRVHENNSENAPKMTCWAEKCCGIDPQKRAAVHQNGDSHGPSQDAGRDWRLQAQPECIPPER